ncbi:thermonuclease family protein [Sporosarcina trichiuri]|uniref:thermonuclease family protein n=1 Tax=Sporosarcina trichiuri TaxID=3056445 RepID=UPI003D67AD40
MGEMPQNRSRRKTKGSLSALVIAVILAGAYYLFGPAEETAPTREGLIPVELIKTIDGDTIIIEYEGKEQNVRYLLIDTPETNHPRLGKQPFGEEAKRRNQEILNSGRLEIEFDVGPKYDKYNRLLAYIYIDGESVQEKLLEEGLARVAYVYPPNTGHLDEYERKQAEAKKKGIGIWTLEDYATDRGFDSTAYPEGKGASSAPKPSSAKDKAKETFANCTKLRKVYPDGVKKGHPAYADRLDGDKDGVACEQR